ncbi:hypothetical protein BDY19DRAFT_490111 [Irpex rosettiformis]|uniref:Uncharacterized protein n=1 Tax=Irpex rosettiformis TaxID=378272 RepID=A0ACB8UE60_9APHY|nr:hypothetical protein BDY19DRAFT_490111 [Irpex rosettiformis]
MTKPSILQSILGRPSQSYSFPPNKDYYSTKHELLRAAVASQQLEENQLKTRSIASAPDSESGYFSSSSAGSQRSEARVASSSVRRSRDQPIEDGTSMPMAQTKSHSPSRRQSLPDRSLSKSFASTDPTTDRTLSLSATSTPPTSFYSNSTVAKTAEPGSPTANDSQSSGSVSETTDSDDEVFYTPRQSFYLSPRTSRADSAAMVVDPRAIADALAVSTLPKVLSKSTLKTRQQRDSPRTASSESLLSSTSSSSAAGTAGSERSSMSRVSVSTRITTPLTSDYGSLTKNAKVETVTIARSHTRTPSTPSIPSASDPNSASSTSQSQSIVSGRAQPRPLAQTRRRSKTELRRASYTDEDWAKEVRWLAPAITAQSNSPRHVPRRLPPPSEFGGIATSSTPSSITASKPLQQHGVRSYPPPAKSAEHRRRSRRSRGSRSSRGRMSALLEEDESEYSDLTPTGSSAEPSRTPSPVREGHTHKRYFTESPTKMSRTLSPFSSTTGSKSLRSGKEPSVSSSDEGAENPDARLRAYAFSKVTGSPRRSYSHTRRLSRSISPTVYSFSQNLPTHSIPAPTPLDAEGSSAPSGYTGLTLPHAAYSGDGKAETGDGKIDLVRMGLAQSSMATVEVTRGAGEQNGGGDARKKRRHFSFTLSLKLPVHIGKGKGKGKDATPSHLLDSLPLPVAFLSHIPPPSYVPSSYILIQVFAVGLDALDSLIVHEKMGNGSGSKGLGFIPGRSVVGKVVECGWDVKGDVCKRNEWVVGLMDVRKCGALAEFVVLERHRVHRAPQPLSRPTTLFPSQQRRSHVRSKSLPSQMNPHPYAQLHRDLVSSMNMTIEELALLPLCALPAHRAIRTCQDVLSPSKLRPNADEVPTKKFHALVLQGHDGIGALAVQMLARRGVSVIVQVPDGAARDDANEGGDSDDEDDEDGVSATPIHKRHTSSQSASPAKEKGKGKGKETVQPAVPKQTRFDKLEARLRAWGAEEIGVGAPLEVVERMVEDGRSFDVVIDTVGGTEIWETCRKLLLADPEQDATRHSPGDSSLSSLSGLTKVGDSPSKPIPTAHDTLRSGFRSIRRSASSRSKSRGRDGSVSPTKSSTSLALPLTSPSKDSLGSVLRRGNSWRGRPKAQKRTVNYAWVSVAADVDFEGEDVRDSLGEVVRMVEEGWIRPWVGGDEQNDAEGGEDVGKSVPFDKAPEVFRRGAEGPVGVLKEGGTCVVRIVA